MKVTAVPELEAIVYRLSCVADGLYMVNTHTGNKAVFALACELETVCDILSDVVESGENKDGGPLYG